MLDLADLSGNVRQLPKRGVNLSLGDFGTGYPSLAAVEQYPFDLVEIDRRFQRGIDAPGSSAPITAAVVALAHSLGMRVVAEGVEFPSPQRNYRHPSGVTVLERTAAASPTQRASCP